MIGTVIVVALVWLLIAAILGLFVAQVIANRDEQKPGGE